MAQIDEFFKGNELNKWKIAFLFCFVTMLASWGFFLHRLLDQAVSITYLKDGYQSTENDLKKIISIYNETDLTRGQIKALMTRDSEFEFVEFERDTIQVNQIILIFKNDKLKRVEKML